MWNIQTRIKDEIMYNMINHELECRIYAFENYTFQYSTLRRSISDRCNNEIRFGVLGANVFAWE